LVQGIAFELTDSATIDQREFHCLGFLFVSIIILCTHFFLPFSYLDDCCHPGGTRREDGYTGLTRRFAIELTSDYLPD